MCMKHWKLDGLNGVIREKKKKKKKERNVIRERRKLGRDC